MTRDESAAALVGDYVSAARLGDLPPEVVHEARRCFLNFVGCAAGGVDHEVVQAAYRALVPYAGTPAASLIGLGERTDSMLAAFVNGTSASAHSFDDTHAEAMVHAGAPVCSATLALAQARGSNGGEFLLAVALGVEVTCRLSKAISVAPAVGDIGWYQTGVTGGIGAAVATGKLLGLEAAQLRNAIGIAAAQASGMRILQGSMSMLMLAGHAAQCGMRASLLAQQGLESPSASIDGRYGFGEVFSTRAHLPWFSSDLGRRHEILSTAYKAYPCGVVLHPVVNACRDVAAQSDLDPDAIESISVRIHPVALALTDRPHPSSRTEGQWRINSAFPKARCRSCWTPRSPHCETRCVHWRTKRFGRTRPRFRCVSPPAGH
jgi:2-methylcitrate dehydratase PrpD